MYICWQERGLLCVVMPIQIILILWVLALCIHEISGRSMVNLHSVTPAGTGKELVKKTLYEMLYEK